MFYLRLSVITILSVIRRRSTKDSSTLDNKKWQAKYRLCGVVKMDTHTINPPFATGLFDMILCKLLSDDIRVDFSRPIVISNSGGIVVILLLLFFRTQLVRVRESDYQLISRVY